MKKIMMTVTFLVASYGFGQVGVNTPNPKSTLDIVKKTANTTNNVEGVLIPRVSKNKAFLMGGNTSIEESTLVFVSDIADYTTTPVAASVSDITKNGYYFWNGTKWVAISTKDEIGWLEKVTENGIPGYRIRGSNPDLYGNIGFFANDLGHNNILSTTIGATGQYSTISGGLRNTSSGFQATVGGGFGNIASGNSSPTVSGGNNNIASGTVSAIGGGRDNKASGICSVVSGGCENIASGQYSSSLGGRSTNALGSYSSTFGGLSLKAESESTIAMGRYNTSETNPQINLFTDLTKRLLVLGNGSTSTKSDAFTILRNGKVGIDIDNFENTTSDSKLQVNGQIQSLTINSNTGTSADKIVVADANGVLKVKAQAPVQANSSGSVALGQIVALGVNATQYYPVLIKYVYSEDAAGINLGYNFSINTSNNTWQVEFPTTTYGPAYTVDYEVMWIAR